MDNASNTPPSEASTKNGSETPSDTVGEISDQKSIEDLGNLYNQGSPPGPPPPPAEEGGQSSDDGGEELSGRMTFLEHLDELRKRIIQSVAALAITFGISWVFHEAIFNFLSLPIKGVVDKLSVIKPTEPFTIYLKVAFVAGVFLAAPFLLFQVWLFIAPGLYRREKIYVFPFLLSSTILFLLGGIFAYYVILPTALNFLLKQFGANFHHMISAVYFFDFEMVILIGMGAIFQLPVLVAFLSLFGLVTPRFLWKNFRYAFLLMIVIAAVVSPTTDVLNLFLWSGPMVILYLISIWVSWMFFRRRRARGKS